MGYYIICTQGYLFEGIEFKKDEIRYHESTQPVFSSKWRRATEAEVNKLSQAAVISSCDCKDNECCYYCEIQKTGTRTLTMPSD